MIPERALLDRFAADLDALIPPAASIGLAVSGGPDSLALLLLAAAARPGKVEAATVDHALRTESADEARAVAAICDRLGVPHIVLRARWSEKPVSAIQERARQERYRLLAGWAKDRRRYAVLTEHHLDDQAETLLMRLARGAGVRGLAGMRARSTVPGSDVPLLRPLLGWRGPDLRRMCAEAGLEAVADPSNADLQFERVRVRRALEQSGWLDPQSLAASAAHLGRADEALDWAVQQEWARSVTNGDGQITYRLSDAPDEIRRRVVARAVSALATEGEGAALKGRELDRVLSALAGGGTATIRGVLCTGGEEWHFAPAPARRG